MLPVKGIALLYLKYFGLREAPFNLTPDPKFFYGSELHREALAALYYGVKNKKGFVVVTGEVGTGKTTVLRKLLRSLEATHHSVFIFNTLVTFDELLETILRDLNIDPAGAGRVVMTERLNEFLLEKVKAGHVVSVLIDEAQNLGEDVLEGVRLLSNMETDREKLIQIILVGQPELEAKLNRPSLRQLKQRVTLWSRLDCLSPADTESYIRHRLKVAGYQGPDIFDSSSLRLVKEHAAGTPRLINAICDNALLTAFAGSRKVVTAEIIDEVIRDLRLAHGAGSADFDRTTVESLPIKPIRPTDEPADAKPMARNRNQEDTFERARMVRRVRPPVAGEVIHNLSLKMDREQSGHYGVPREREVNAAPKNVASIVEAKDRKTGLRAAETDDYKGQSIRHGEFIGSGSVSAGCVPQEFFNGMVRALVDAMGPMASLVLNERIAVLDESPDEFPIVRLPELVAAVKREILSESLRKRFEKEVAEQILAYSKTAGRRTQREPTSSERAARNK